MSVDPPSDISRPRILVVDDDRGDLDLLGGLLLPHYEVLAAPSAEMALQVALDIPKPDLILLDVMMPGMDGYAVLVRLRDNAATRDIPVIFVTGRDSIEDEEKGLALGAADYIAKPYRPPIILARVRAQLELKLARNRLEDQNIYLESELVRRLKENEQGQLQLLQSEKMAAVGQLAAGIAHEINNPVGFVASNLGSLDGYLKDLYSVLDAYAAIEALCPADAPALARICELKQQKEIDFLRVDSAELIAESRQGMARVIKIVNDLKNFSRAEGNVWLLANLHDGLDSTLNIVWNEIKYHCTLTKEYGEIPEVNCIPSQINQVLMNLLVNAAQAIPEKGVITLRTGQAGDEVFIAIADTGAGIPAEILPRLFEPFFTTKPVGKGTGLGLSIAYGIVHKHGGRIEVASTIGEGTTFTVWLPVKPPPDEAAVAVATPPA